MSWKFYTPSVLPVDLVTALPATPVDGQIVTLTDSLTAPTYAWRLRYVAAKASNKWLFIGGSPAVAAVTASEACSTTAYSDLSTAGPSITVPVAGLYDVGFDVEIDVTTTGNIGLYATVKIGSAAAAELNRIGGHGRDAQAGRIQHPSSGFRITAAASDALKVQYRVASTGTFSAGYRNLRVTPFALGG